MAVRLSLSLSCLQYARVSRAYSNSGEQFLDERRARDFDRNSKEESRKNKRRGARFVPRRDARGIGPVEIFPALLTSAVARSVGYETLRESRFLVPRTRTISISIRFEWKKCKGETEDRMGGMGGEIMANWRIYGLAMSIFAEGAKTERTNFRTVNDLQNNFHASFIDFHKLVACNERIRFNVTAGIIASEVDAVYLRNTTCPTCGNNATLIDKRI